MKITDASSTYIPPFNTQPTPPFDHDKYTREYNAYTQELIDRNTRLFHPNGSNAGPTQRYGSGAGQQPYFTPGAFRTFRAAIYTMIFAPVMMRIGKNWYEKTGDWQYALGRAIIVSAMWKVWGTAIFWWMGVNWCLSNPDTNWFTRMEDGSPNDPKILAVCRLFQWLALFALLLAYCKLVDRSLFKHRFVYRAFGKIRRWVDWCPWVVCISLVLLPIFFYIQMTVVLVPDAPVSLR